MKDHEIEVDDETSSLLAAIAEAKDDPLLIAELAQVDPTEFRQFISECGGVEDENATQLLKASESLQRAEIKRTDVVDYRRDSGDSLSTLRTYPRTIVHRQSPFRLMNMLFLGLGVSFAYGLLGSALLTYLGGKSEAQLFFTAYTSLFKTIISLGLILGTALIVFSTQNVIPQTIEAAFTETQLSETDYFYYKRQFFSLRRSITFPIESVVIAFIIFSSCQFPLSRPGEILMVIAACIEYALGAYIGRKFVNACLMLHSLLRITVKRNLFRKRELDAIKPYVYVTSTLTVISVSVHVIGYYGGPFLYGSILGQSIKPFLILPALMATLVFLTLNFYPRAVLQTLYGESIDVEIKRLKKAMRNEALSAYEKRSYLMEFDKMSRDELRSSLKWLTLDDLPIWATILITMLGPLLKL
jgi:hypothetical protein